MDSQDKSEPEHWARLASDSGASMFRLVKAELLLSLSQMPQLFALWIITIPLLLLAWISLAVLAGWLVFAYFDQVGLGILVFFLLQVLACLGIFVRIMRVEKVMFFPVSRKQFHKLGGRPDE